MIRKNKSGVLLGAAIVGGSSPLFAQATAESTVTTEIANMVTSGNAVGIAALGLFTAAAIFGVVKRFFNKGK